MKGIFDNIIFTLQKSGGISVYWHELINRLLENSNVQISFIEDINGGKNIFRGNLLIEKIKIFDKKIYNQKFLSRYRKISLNVRNEKIIFHSSYYRTLSKKVKEENLVKEVVTVHDFTYEHFVKGPKKWIHTLQKKNAIKAADIVICISENTKKDLLHFYPEFANKEIRIVYNGVSGDYFKISKSNLITNNKYFLFVGSRADYKNFDFTIKAVAQTKDFMLKIVGGKLNNKEVALLEKLLPNRWELIENANNSTLNVLYNEAFALVYPSSYEGFGIPLVESMKAGCPFITLNTSSIPEVAGNAGVLLDKLDMTLFNEAVNSIKDNRKEMIELGFAQANKFSWEKCCNETLEIYNDMYKQLI